MFEKNNMDKSGLLKPKGTKHQNYINCTQPYVWEGDTVKVISTSDPNGNIEYWDVTKQTAKP